MRPEDERSLAMFCHLSSLLWIPLVFIGLPIPFASVVIPLLVWSIQREKSQFVDHHGRESLNFQISLLIYGFVLIVLSLIGLLLFVLVLGAEDLLAGRPTTLFIFTTAVSLYGLLLVIWGVFQIALVVWAAIAAYQGKKFYYPLTIRFFRSA